MFTKLLGYKKLLVVLPQLIALSSIAQKSFTVSSPNKKLSAICTINKNGDATYNILYLQQPLLEKSKLGIVREDADFSIALLFVSASKNSIIKDSYHILTAKKSNINYIATQKIIALKTASGKRMNIVFRVSNDGVAFQYQFPQRSNELKKISAEATTFHFKDSTKAWLQPKTEAQSGWEHSNPSYEAHYMMAITTGTPSPTKNGWVYPAMFCYKNVWMLITEASLGKTYCGTALQQLSPNNEYSIGFPQAPETMKDSALNPQSILPWHTPWRIITVGNLQTIAESTLGTDLAFPAKKMDTNFIKPGKASWSWILLKDNSIVYDVQKKYIDYAADMHWDYCLIDADWDKKIGYDKIEELTKYAASKKVNLLLWYNSAGNWNTVKYAPRNILVDPVSRNNEFARIEKMGIKGVKIDFFAGDGQWMIEYYQNILEDAAKHHLLVNFHGATLPRGWQRTYPNLMTTEAVYGYEMITFAQKDADLAPQHMVMSAFARNAFDPMDFTPVSLYKIPKINRVTSPCFELATGIIFLSGIQHYVEGPDGMAHVNAAVKKLMQTIPSVWDDVKFIDGYPGKYYVVARRAGKKWYIAGINADSTDRKITIDLSFISKQFKQGGLYSDYPSNTEFPVEFSRFNLIPKQKATITMKPNGGFVLVL
ncbi:MAG: glycoside hydrolase family 97 catalytic domain-containing protein [Flavobacterium sp.]|nr:glycoside hydrolase family 97 catalytic domain-containing protein [Flavobacterium sp.]